MNIGAVLVAPEALLDQWDFKGGRVLECKWDSERRLFWVYIEHPDMPEYVKGSYVEDVVVHHAIIYENGVCERSERAHPPKKAVVP